MTNQAPSKVRGIYRKFSFSARAFAMLLLWVWPGFGSILHQTAANGGRIEIGAPGVGSFDNQFVGAGFTSEAETLPGSDAIAWHDFTAAENFVGSAWRSIPSQAERFVIEGTSDAPEPQPAILIALGVALLALRRFKGPTSGTKD